MVSAESRPQNVFESDSGLCDRNDDSGAVARIRSTVYVAPGPTSHRSEATTATATKVIIDTDPGVDDAFALMLAMRSPELNVMAVTAVAGNLPLEITLPNALRMVEICDRTDIPVAAGASVPLIRRQVTASYAHGENGLGGVSLPPPKITAIKEHATELICRIVLEHPGEVTLIGLGPLTNLALALRSEPNLAKAIKSIVLMGGSLSGGNVTPALNSIFMSTRKQQASSSTLEFPSPWSDSMLHARSS